MRRGRRDPDPGTFTEIASTLGSVQVLINNAGVGSSADVAALEQSDWDSFFGVDLKGSWLTAKYAIPQMRGIGGGAIVNISSIHATLTRAGMFPYAAAKAGILGLTRSMALDLAADHIRVNAPPATSAPHRLKPLTTPDPTLRPRGHAWKRSTPSGASAPPKRFPPSWRFWLRPQPVSSPALPGTSTADSASASP